MLLTDNPLSPTSPSPLFTITLPLHSQRREVLLLYTPPIDDLPHNKPCRWGKEILLNPYLFSPTDCCWGTMKLPAGETISDGSVLHWMAPYPAEFSLLWLVHRTAPHLEWRSIPDEDRHYLDKNENIREKKMGKERYRPFICIKSVVEMNGRRKMENFLWNGSWELRLIRTCKKINRMKRIAKEITTCLWVFYCKPDVRAGYCSTGEKTFLLP